MRFLLFIFIIFLVSCSRAKESKICIDYEKKNRFGLVFQKIPLGLNTEKDPQIKILNNSSVSKLITLQFNIGTAEEPLLWISDYVIHPNRDYIFLDKKYYTARIIDLDNYGSEKVYSFTEKYKCKSYKN